MQRIPSYKEILKIAIPLMVAGISESIASVVDTAFMGALGTMEMDGMGMTSMFYLLIFMIGWSISRSVQISVSQNYGANMNENIADIVFNAISIIVPISLFLLILLIFFSPNFLRYLIHDPDILNISIDVSRIRAWGVPVVMFTSILISFYTGIGYTKPIIWIQGVAALSNIILNYGLVFGHLGLPEMGYQGSAIATVISEVIGLLCLFFTFLFRVDIVKKYRLFTIRKIQKSILLELARLAYPMLVLHIFSLGAWVYFFSQIERMGKVELAISIILKQVFMMIAIPSFCMANTSNTLVGNLVGSRDIDSIIPTIKKIAFLNFGIMTGIACLLFFFHFPIVGIFTQDPMVLNHYYYSLLVILTLFFFMPFGNVYFNSISALGNTRIPLFIEVSVIIIYLIYMYLVINKWKLGLEMAWSSEVIYWILMVGFTVGYFYFMNWKERIVFLDQN